MKSDKDFAKLLKLMQRQGEANNPVGLEIGVMTGAKSCSVGDLELDTDDLLIAEHLLTGYYTKNNVFIKPLAKGDVVAVQQVDDETYVILERMVGS